MASSFRCALLTHNSSWILCLSNCWPRSRSTATARLQRSCLQYFIKSSTLTAPASAYKFLEENRRSFSNMNRSRTTKPKSISNYKLLKPVRVRPSFKGGNQSNGNKKESENNPFNTLKLASAMEKMEEVESLADNINANVNRLGSGYTAWEAEEEQLRYLEKLNRKVRFKTIERKFFRKPKTPNLLTWAAKEQLRHLHHQQEWSVEDLADHFPVSEESVWKILKSRVRLHRHEDIRRHDQGVRRNWQNIKSSLEGEKGSALLDTLTEGMGNSRGELVVTGAAGIGNQPLPQIVGPAKVQGPFSLIVQDCFAEKKQEHRKKVKEDTEIRELFLSELKEISSLVQQSFEAQEAVKPKKFRNVTHLDLEGLDEFRRRDSAHQFIGQTEIEIKKGIKVEVRKDGDRSNKPVTFQQGDCVYGADGEFLYRIP